MENKNAAWLTLAIVSVFIIIGLYLWYRYLKIKEGSNGVEPIFPWEDPDPNPYTPPPDTPDPVEPPDQNPDPGDGDTDPYTPPGYQMIQLNKTVSNKHSITFNFDQSYYGTILSGTFRVGGSVYTNVRIHYKKGGSWRHVGTFGGWPGGFTQFAVTINDQIEGVKLVAEQGLIPWLGERFIDEVHGQLVMEVS